MRNILIALLFICFGLQMTFFTGFRDDDIYYASEAYKISKGIKIDFTQRDYTGGIRLGLLLPTALSFCLFGVNQYSAALFPMLCAFGSIIVIYLLGRELFDKKSAFWAAFLYVFFPLNIIYSTTLYPDLPASFFLGLSILVFIKAFNHKGNTALFSFLVSGIILGAAYLIKEVVLLAVLIYAVIVIDGLKNKKSIRWVSFFVLGLTLVIVAEALYLRLIYGVWINSLIATSHLQSGILSFVAYEKEMAGLSRYLYWMFVSPYQTGFFFYALIICAGFLIFKKFTPLEKGAASAQTERVRNSLTGSPRKNIVMAWFLVFFLFLQFGSSSLSHYAPLPKQPRYLLFIAMPMFLIIGSAIPAAKKGIAMLLLGSGIIILCFSGIFFIFINNAMSNSYDQPVKDTYEELKRLPMKEVYVSWDYFYKLKAYFKFKRDAYIIPFSKKKSLSFEEIKKRVFEPLGDSYLVNNLWRSPEPSIFYPNQLDNPPKNWEVIAHLDTSLSRKQAHLFNYLEYFISCPIIPGVVKSKIVSTLSIIKLPKRTLIYYIP